MKRVFIMSALIFAFLILGTIGAIFYAKGYHFGGPTRIEGTGLLVLTSHPDGASVYINDHLTTATNNTINLSPGDYDVKIQKDGYFPWHKKITVKKEIVAQADATLFPTAPKLESITLTGASDPVMDPTGSLIAYTVASASASKNGVYILDMNARPILSLGGGATQITNDPDGQFLNAVYSFSPDSQQLLASVSSGLNESTMYVLNPHSGLQTPQDVTATLATIQVDWAKQKADRDKKLIDTLPRELRTIATNSFTNMALSVDENRMFYVATASATLPPVINPPLVAVNSTPQDRNVKEGNAYVYDIKEDRNYLLMSHDSLKKDEAMPQFFWSADSTHLFYVRDQKINTMEYDATNFLTLYAGPFSGTSLFPWPDGSALVILTNFNNPFVTTNLYRISLK